MPDQTPYASALPAYLAAGWPAVLPVPPEAKTPPPAGFSGADGRDPGPGDYTMWSAGMPHWSVALRLPDGVVGIDVDEYVKGSVTKNGAATLAYYREKLGELPPTWSSTARGAGPSRILFYRVPAGVRFRSILGPCVEIIQRHHRYAVVAPSWHHSYGASYEWYTPAGVLWEPAPGGIYPGPAVLAELPAAWVAELSEGASTAGPAAADANSGARMLMGIHERDRTRDPCAEVFSATVTALAALDSAEEGSRHDVTTGRVHHLVMLGASGHPGVGASLNELGLRWDTLTPGEGRDEEFHRMALTSARKAVTALGRTEPLPADPCLLTAGGTLVPPPPAVAAPPTVGANTPPGPGAAGTVTLAPSLPLFHPRQCYGAHPFEPAATSDQQLAESVLERLYPVLRYAADADQWLVRGAERWALREDLTGWAVTQVAPLLPKGDATAEKGTPEQRAAALRARLLSSAGNSAVSRQIRNVVRTDHPATLELAELDADPELLWAGGRAWSLRDSGTQPVAFDLDPGTPHTHSARYAPAPVATPCWDAFVAAVWPDPEVRGWALRVLSIAVTGYADAALPVLLGPRWRGKTQVVALLAHMLGTYAHSANPKLLSSGDNSHDAIVYELKGRRLSFIDEGPRNGVLAQERLKQLTGGGDLTGRMMRANPVTFAPSHTLVLTANEEPTLTDDALRRRVRLIPCEGDVDTVRAARRALGPVRGAVWASEAPGVLAQLMAHAAAWLADSASGENDAAPASIRGRADDLAAEQEPVARWVEGECLSDPAGSRSGELYEAFVAWCRRNAIREVTTTKWGRQLSEYGYAAGHTREGNTRPLRLRGPGLFRTPLTLVPPVSGTPVSGTPQPLTGNGMVTSRGGCESEYSDITHIQGITDKTVSGSTLHGEPLSAQPVTNQNTTSDPLFSSSVKGVNSSLLLSVENKTSSYIDNIGKIGTPPLTPHTLHNTPERADSPGGETPTVKPPTTLRKAPTPEALAKRLSAAESKRLAAIEAAAGASVALPALVSRAAPGVPATVEHIALAHVADVVRQQATAWGATDVDVEHSGYPIGHPDYVLRTIQLGGPERAVVLDAADPAHLEAAGEMLAAAARIEAHSAQADVVPLQVAGLLPADDSAWSRVYDTVLPAKLADPGQTGSDPSLKAVAPALLGTAALSPSAELARKALFKAGRWAEKGTPVMPPDKSGWAQVPITSETQIRYAGSDVLDTAMIARMIPWPETALLERERAAQRITSRITLHGLPLARDRVLGKQTEHREALETARQAVTGYAPEIDNPGSNPQVAAAMAARGAQLPATPTGKASVAESALEPLANAGGHLGALARAVLDYRHHATVLSMFLDPFAIQCLHGDSRFRTTIYTLQADTGRMSSVRFNAQQLPKQGGVRGVIEADPGYVLISADFSGVEVRVAAGLSQDRYLIELLRNGLDLHAEIARMVFGPEFTKADRYAVKPGVFGDMYGAAAETMAVQMGTSTMVAQAVKDAISTMAPAYRAWAAGVKQGVRRGYTELPTYTGRTIHFDKRQPHKAPNYAIQGNARELIVDALLRWEQTPYAGGIVIPVHDEIVAQVREDVAEDAVKTLVECMTTEFYGVPIVAEGSKPSRFWMDAT